MKNKTIDVNNGRKIQIEFTNNGLRITHIDSSGEIEVRDQINDGEFVMLLNLFQALQNGTEKSVYILDNFATEILNQSGGIDYAEEFRIIQ